MPRTEFQKSNISNSLLGVSEFFFESLKVNEKLSCKICTAALIVEVEASGNSVQKKEDFIGEISFCSPLLGKLLTIPLYKSPFYKSTDVYQTRPRGLGFRLSDADESRKSHEDQ